MKYIFLVFVIAANCCDSLSTDRSNFSEFATLWTPKFVQDNEAYQSFILPVHLDEPTEAGIEFRKSYATVKLEDNKLAVIKFKRRRIVNPEFIFTMTLLRNTTVRGSRVQKCSTKMQTISALKNNFYNFIQTDKPIYNPGDDVQFRILTVDRDLKPYHRNDINVIIIDPNNVTQDTFSNQTNQYKGVFTGSFKLSLSPTLGNYTIQVIVDKKPDLITSKTFAVQKYTLPLFKVYLEVETPHLLPTHDLIINYYAKYSFGDYVTGNARIVIKDIVSGKVYLNQTRDGIEQAEKFKKNVKSLKIEDEGKFEVFVEFTEPQSGITFNSTAIFHVHYSTKHILTVLHPEKFLPDFPFTTEVFVRDWQNKKIMEHIDPVNIFYDYKLDNDSTGTFSTAGKLKNGIFINEFIIPSNVSKLSIKVTFINTHSYADIEKGLVSVGINRLDVAHSPQQPKLSEKVTIIVKSDTELNDVIALVTTRNGNMKNKKIDCSFNLTCTFEWTIQPEMMPQSTLVVYSIVNQQRIYQGKTIIETENLGKNYLQFELPTNQIKPKENITIEFKTQPKSEVYVLGFDKRLTYLRHGNDFTKSDVIKAVADYDGENKIIVDDLKDWHVCKPEELERVERGRKYIAPNSDGDTFANEDDEDYDGGEGDEGEEGEEGGEGDDTGDTNDIILNPDDLNEPSITKPPKPESEEDLIRDLFPETWIFEKFEMGDQNTLQKIFTAVDSITTWIISAFSVNDETGIAIAPTQELVVKQDFFVKINLPYSIRYTEILRVDVLVFNYREPLNVKVTLGNYKKQEIELVEYKTQGNVCMPMYRNDSESSTTVSVPKNSVRIASFYIRTKVKGKGFDKFERIVNIKVIGRVEGTKIFDGIVKKLNVEPLGIKDFKVNAVSFNFQGVSRTHNIDIAASEGQSRINLIVTGDMIGDAMKQDEMISISWYDCLEQKTSKLKRNVHIYRYLEKKNKSPNKNFIVKQKKEVNDEFTNYNYDYKHFSWYRAHLVDALSIALKSKALDGDKLKLEIGEHFEYLKKNQNSNGSFKNFNIDRRVLNIGGDFTNELYFATAFCLIPFIKHNNIENKNYDDVIKKGFDYLDKNLKINMKVQVRSIGAYVYALAGKNDKSKRILDDARSFAFYRDGKRCYKLNSDDTSCDTVHTAYIAMTCLTLNLIADVEPIINYLINVNIRAGTWQDTFYNALVTEPIVEMGIAKSINTITNLNIEIKNNQGLKKKLYITDENAQNPVKIILPTHSTGLKAAFNGHGFCTLTTISEHFIKIDKINSKFSVNVNAAKTSNSNSIVISMCATYHPQEMSDPDTIMNAIYEVNMPSGYVYNGIENLNTLTEIKQVTEAREKSLIVIYYNDFKKEKYYCVKINAKKVHEVKKVKPAGVKVYDFNHKDSITVAFYKLQSDECRA